ncbi:lipid-binding SYLF domain-containing protein [Pacificitalea manganoxidans]|nr:YSC84-related protein [Pacificitalea manganoxidans]MDR6307981.1 lipid-binding SYLF domain-containing protein [Pacificitalea manganoxidans]|tara:strand:- start:145 stop:720 length:576 start_codon:yes stop_codon:yes gene_type:complete
MSMQTSFLNRRRLIAGMAAGGATLLAGCGNGVGNPNATTIDQRVDATQNFLFNRYPGTRDLAAKAAGILFMPLITKAGIGIGGSYGRGALRINGATVDYYSATQATIGLQIGAQQYGHALFFMTQEALRQFRTSAGWSVGADAEYALNDQGGNLSAETLTALDPVIALVFGQSGLIVGATLEGTKYQRILP